MISVHRGAIRAPSLEEGRVLTSGPPAIDNVLSSSKVASLVDGYLNAVPLPSPVTIWKTRYLLVGIG